MTTWKTFLHKYSSSDLLKSFLSHVVVVVVVFNSWFLPSLAAICSAISRENISYCEVFSSFLSTAAYEGYAC